uniref:C2H2-type domain-containing protein n=2 Tax=Photinus pyralis TaxID=7054 RepID=A0A1Y1MIX9_PHOPY
MDSAVYDTDKILTSFEDGTFRRVYGSTRTISLTEIITQLHEFVSWLNTTVIPYCNLEIESFDAEQRAQFFQIADFARDRLARVKDVRDPAKRCNPYMIRCSKCGELVKIDCWESIQQHEHFEQVLSNQNSVLDLQPPVQVEGVGTASGCTCAVTLPTKFKFRFSVGYFPEVVRFFYITREFKNDTVYINGVSYYTLRIIDDDMCSCLICDTIVGRKSVVSHIEGKRHTANKVSASLPNVEVFHKQWMSQELAFQVHQLYFVPFNKYYTLCELCTCSYVAYTSLKDHLLDKRHKKLILEQFKTYRNVAILKMQAQLYGEEVEAIEPDNGQTDEIASISPIKSSIVNGYINENTCNNCLTFTPQSPMRFDFVIHYHSNLERLLYGNHQFSGKTKMKNGSELHLILSHNATDCACLLCCCKFALKLTKEHLEGAKHFKKANDSQCVDNLEAYHRYWIGQEVEYQAHQVYFLPSSANSATCQLCKNLNVFYDLIHHHLKDKCHKQQVLQENSQQSDLLVLQRKVYQTNSNNFDLLINDVEQPDAVVHDLVEIPSTSANGTRKLSENSNEKSDSESEDEPSDTENDQPQTDAKPVTKEDVEHKIVKSFDGNSQNELHNLIEHRHWADFDRGMRITQTHVECLVCKVKLAKEREQILLHVMLTSHKVNVGNKKKTKFYCEICNTHIHREPTWLYHIRADRHKDRCQKLGSSRQLKLTEYECTTCQLVIFGDDMSIMRHRMTRQGKGKRSKKITLNQKVKNLLVSEKFITQEANRLVKEAKEVLQNQAKVNECCCAIKAALTELYPHCAVYPFGSQVSGLGNKHSDLDLFVDLDDMYFGEKNQDSRNQVRYVTDVMKVFVKKPKLFRDLNPIASARTPIVQVYHVPTQLDCDLSFRHGLSVENTKYLRLCIELQPTIQQLILILKQWLVCTKLTGHITTYSLSMMVIFFYQSLGYLTAVHKLKYLAPGASLIIDGWGVINFDSFTPEAIRPHINLCEKSLKELLVDFFLYYSKFNYEKDVICPLLGHTIIKSLFSEDAQVTGLPLEMSIYVRKVSENTTEHFRSESAMCIQDPFDLSHNLTKGCSAGIVNKLKQLCGLTHTFLTTGK